MTSDHQVAVWQALLNSVDAFDQGVLHVIARGEPPLSQATLQALAAIPGAKPTISKVRSSIEKLKRGGFLSKTVAGTHLDDPLLAEFLRQRASG